MWMQKRKFTKNVPISDIQKNLFFFHNFHLNKLNTEKCILL